MTQKPRKAGTRIAQGAPVDDPRIIRTESDAEALDLPVFKWTQLQAPYIRRSDITHAPYNPRSMDASGKKKLREGLKRYGLVERPVFNATTGLLVGGHQRLEQMDKLMGLGKECEDYLLPVNAISMSEKEEAELNVLLNNPSVQGTYDTGALEQLFGGDVNPFAAGFDNMDLGLMFGGDFAAELAERFGVSEGEEEDGGEDDGPAPDARTDGLGDTEALQAEADKIEALKARKREQVAEDRERNDSDHILHIVFRNPKEKRRYLESYGMDPEQRYVDAQRWMENVEHGEADDLPFGDG